MSDCSKVISMKASVRAIVEEATPGVLVKPTLGAQFIKLRTGFASTSAFEEIESDELIDSIGASEPALGKETPTGTHPAYLRHSGTEAIAPELDLMYQSGLGGKLILAAEQTADDSFAGDSDAPASVEVATPGDYRVGMAVLIKDGINGYNIRNVEAIVGSDLELNYNIATAPGVVGLGRPVFYFPTSTCHKTFSDWVYFGKGGAIQAMAGCLTSSMNIVLNANQRAEIEFGYDGIQSYFNPMCVDATNETLDFIDTGGTHQISLPNEIFRTPIALAGALETGMNAVSVDTHTVEYDSQTGKYIFKSDGANLSLLFNSGAGNATTIGALIGFSDADFTGALTYTSDETINLDPSVDPVFDLATDIILKNSELMFGGFDDNICVSVSELSISIEKPSVDVDDLCSASGVEEKVPESRTVTLTAKTTMKKYEAQRFSDQINNKTTSVMFNGGVRDAAGNWVPGKCLNIYMPNLKITTHNVEGEAFATVAIEAKGFVNTNFKDVYINLV